MEGAFSIGAFFSVLHDFFSTSLAKLFWGFFRYPKKNPKKTPKNNIIKTNAFML
tara:strand:+ start:32 stop:193 length:162 start_codon:yes stop_codon:yes gene_type:complete